MTTTIAVSGGKGGVGKTTIAVNLASWLARNGRKTLLVDADFGMANSHILCGLKTEETVEKFLTGSEPLEGLIHKLPWGLNLLAGGTSSVELLNLRPEQRGNFIRSLKPVAKSYDYVVVDVAAGASDASLEFCAACEKLLVIIMGEPTSFMDAYSLTKSANLDFGLECFGVLVNQASSKKQAEALFSKFQSITQKFLTVDQRYIGYLPASDLIRKSIVARRPIMSAKKATLEESCFTSIAFEIDELSSNKFDGLKVY